MHLTFLWKRSILSSPSDVDVCFWDVPELHLPGCVWRPYIVSGADRSVNFVEKNLPSLYSGDAISFFLSQWLEPVHSHITAIQTGLHCYHATSVSCTRVQCRDPPNEFCHVTILFFKIFSMQAWTDAFTSVEFRTVQDEPSLAQRQVRTDIRDGVQELQSKGMVHEMGWEG